VSFDLTVTPGVVFAKTYWTENPSTGKKMNRYITEIGLDVDACATLMNRHSFSLNTSIGGGGPSGAMPLTYGAIGTSYQIGKKKSGVAAGPTVQLTSKGVACGVKISIFRMDIHLTGWPGRIAAGWIGVAIG
jgi:hypothetical protein